MSLADIKLSSIIINSFDMQALLSCISGAALKRKFPNTVRRRKRFRSRLAQEAGLFKTRLVSGIFR